MSDDTQRVSTADLKLVLRNTATASRDAAAALEATERLVIGIGARFDALEGRLTGSESRFGALESRFTALETRFTALETRAGSLERGMDSIARSNHRIEGMLADILARVTP
jgi:hypothetical protein